MPIRDPGAQAVWLEMGGIIRQEPFAFMWENDSCKGPPVAKAGITPGARVGCSVPDQSNGTVRWRSYAAWHNPLIGTCDPVIDA
jgi:hypothetical protein